MYLGKLIFTYPVNMHEVEIWVPEVLDFFFDVCVADSDIFCFFLSLFGDLLFRDGPGDVRIASVPPVRLTCMTWKFGSWRSWIAL